MTDIEIPYEKERNGWYRFFEILPGMLTWTMLALPFILSLISVTLAVFFVLGYLLMWLARSIAINIRALQGYHTLSKCQKLDWLALLDELEIGNVAKVPTRRPEWHYENLRRLELEPPVVKPSELIHVAMIATYNESREVLEPTIQSVLNSNYDTNKIILVVAYEERGGVEVGRRAHELVRQYKHHFMDAIAIEHPRNIPGEIVGKGGNITYAGRQMQKYFADAKIDPLRVVVTTLDADNRPHKNYFAALAYTYAACPDPLHISFQPISMYTNNIWDAPAPMRVIATGNSFWNIMSSLRPHLLRNFSSHAQSMQTLIDTDFWSVRTIVEDGHQFWRTYFRYDGNHHVVPIYVPIYQDAVLSDKYIKTLRAQFVQLRRWTWGASDVAYVAQKGFLLPNKAPKLNVIIKFLRLLESHVTWAVAPLVLAFSAFVPVLFNSQSYAANILPVIVSRVQTIALIGIFVTLFISLKTLPPKPQRYKAHRNIFMIAQWVLLPLTTIVYNSLAALNSQTRLMFKWYIDKFDVTEKAVISDDRKARS